jgi:Putative beta barrel porin-7 (BBP7)
LDGSEFAYLISSPGVSTGGVRVASTTWMQSFDINVAADLINQRNIDVQLLAGFRLLNLEEDLRIQESIIPLQAGVFLFQTGPADPPNTLNIVDHFRTVNRFYGAQVGGRFNWNLDKFNVAVTGKVALGGTQEVITADGSTSLLTPGAPTVTAPGGILVQPTNSGRTVRNEFSVVPEVGINLGYQFTRHIKAIVGYDFLYWSNVARPGDQIDRTVNFTQVPIDPTFGTQSGPARPVLIPHSTDFWVQGLNLGIEIQF